MSRLEFGENAKLLFCVLVDASVWRRPAEAHVGEALFVWMQIGRISRFLQIIPDPSAH